MVQTGYKSGLKKEEAALRGSLFIHFIVLPNPKLPFQNLCILIQPLL